jgi:hypothetical protein
VLATVGGWLDVRADFQAPVLATVGGSLSVRADFQAPVLATVGGSLSVSADFQAPVLATVGGDLDVRADFQAPVLATVGGWLDVSADYKKSWADFVPTKVTWPLVTPDGKFIIADGILQNLVSKKGLTYRVRGLTSEKVTYLVTDGAGKFAHGDTLGEARDSLVYKIGDRDKSKFEGMTVETVMPFGEAIEAYRVITGACEAGTKGFVAQVGKKESYTIGEIIELTEGRYGHEEFKRFFSNNRVSK